MRGAIAEKSPVRKAAYAFQAVQTYQEIIESRPLITAGVIERANAACDYAMFVRELILAPDR